jgi:hypothetical protein
MSATHTQTHTHTHRHRHTHTHTLMMHFEIRLSCALAPTIFKKQKRLPLPRPACPSKRAAACLQAPRGLLKVPLSARPPDATHGGPKPTLAAMLGARVVGSKCPANSASNLSRSPANNASNSSIKQARQQELIKGGHKSSRNLSRVKYVMYRKSHVEQGVNTHIIYIYIIYIMFRSTITRQHGNPIFTHSCCS